jgi:uncharacterized protein (TIGR00255 family)
MIKSMTGYGRFEHVTDGYKIIAEIKSINHRYLDLNVRLPRKLSFFETAIRNILKGYISRGKVDVFVSYEEYADNQETVCYNSSIAREYLTHLKTMGVDFGLDDEVKATALAHFPDVFTLKEQSIDEDMLLADIKMAVVGAAEKFVVTRVNEGENISSDMLGKLANISGWVSEIEVRSPDILKEYRAKLEEKVRELLDNTQIDENRVAMEIVLFADKVCTDEETVRLKSHITHMEESLKLSEDGVGRKLDFIAQELNREANTILSKANDIQVSNIAISLKTEIEKIREQIQNVE